MRRALLLALLVGCGAPAGEAAEPRVLIAARADEPGRVPESGPREPPIGAPTVHPCEHARRCCHAYIDALAAQLPPQTAEGVRTACESIGRLQESAGADGCKAAMRGWRDALEAMSREIPPACGEP